MRDHPSLKPLLSVGLVRLCSLPMDQLTSSLDRWGAPLTVSEPSPPAPKREGVKREVAQEAIDPWGVPVLVEDRDERIPIETLFHGTHEEGLERLQQRPIRSHMTLGTWLADIETARQYGSIVYRVVGPKRDLKLKPYYGWVEVMEESLALRRGRKLTAQDSLGLTAQDYQEIAQWHQSEGFDGIMLMELDGIMGVFVCVWHDYAIELERA